MKQAGDFDESDPLTEAPTPKKTTTAAKAYSKVWTSEDYRRFAEALVIFKDTGSNNRIAKYMGEHVDPIRVRLERSKHQKLLKRQEKEAAYYSI